jgi:hypothetical protein
VALATTGLIVAPHPTALLGQDWAVRYTAKQLNCARFRETGESRIQTSTGGRTRDQTSERRGIWQFRATPSGEGITLEGWLDSLSVSRRSPETTISPDTDGLLGGRYRGTLTGFGAYSSEMRPFVPDEIAEVAGMATALDDFFPPLPSRQLRPRERWTDSAGLTITRLTDSSLSGLPLFRFELRRTEETRSPARLRDSLAVPRKQVSQEQGSFVWHPLLGMLRRERTIVVQTTVPISRAVRQPVRSRVEQRITVSRDLAGDPTACRPS